MPLPNIFEEPGALLEEAGAPGIFLGLGALLLAPVVIPIVAGVGKPVAKAAIKGSIALYEKSKGAFAELGEVVEDLVAEAKAEIADSKQQEISSASHSD